MRSSLILTWQAQEGLITEMAASPVAVAELQWQQDVVPASSLSHHISCGSAVVAAAHRRQNTLYSVPFPVVKLHLDSTPYLHQNQRAGMSRDNNGLRSRQRRLPNPAYTSGACLML